MGEVLAHCAGGPGEGAKYVAAVIAGAPGDPAAYEALAELRRTMPDEVETMREGGEISVIAAYAHVLYLDGDMDEAAIWLGTAVGVRPEIAWADAPWFGDARFLEAVSPAALAEAALRTMDRGHDLDSDEMRTRLRPWFHAIDVVADRDQDPEALARMAMMLRDCGLTDAAHALLDRAGPAMLVEVVRAGIWLRLDDKAAAAAAFERAIDIEPDNWSLYLDLAEIKADVGDYAAAVAAVDQGIEHAPDEPKLRAARAAFAKLAD